MRHVHSTHATGRQPPEFLIFMNSSNKPLQEEMSYWVMRLLQENPDLTQRELAEKLGVSVGGVNYCLKALVDKGWVKMKSLRTLRISLAMCMC